MRAILPYLILVLSISFSLAGDYGEPGPKETDEQSVIFLRVEHLQNQQKLVMLADPNENVVQLLLEEDGRIVDCAARKRAKYALENLVEESETAEEKLNLPHGVQYLEIESDINWYGKYCRRYIRNKLRESEFGDVKEGERELVKQITDRKWIQKGVPGTSFCRTSSPSVPLQESSLGENASLDKCCLGLHSCDDSIYPLDYKNNTFNADLFPIFSCGCTTQFLTCLQDVNSQESQRIIDLWRFAGRCYNLETSMDCLEYNTWFTDCTNGTETSKAVLSTIF